MESAPQQRSVAQPSSSTRSPRFFPNSASTQRPLRPFTQLAPSLEGSVILCPKSTKPATLTTFRINTCKSVSKQRTLTTFRINTCEKQGEGGANWNLPSTISTGAATAIRSSLRFRHHMRHVAPLSLVPSRDCAYFLLPRDVACPAFSRHSPLTTRHFPFVFIHLQPLYLSLRSFSGCPSLFSTACSLLLPKHPGWGISP